MSRIRAMTPWPGAFTTLDGKVLKIREVSLDERATAGLDPGLGSAGTVAVAGRSTLAPEALEPAGIARAYLLSDLEPDPERSMREPAPLLRELARRIAGDWLGGDP